MKQIMNLFRSKTQSGVSEDSSKSSVTPATKDRVAFASLGLIEPIMAALKAEGYEHPTPIQVAAIPHVLKGTDLIACAQTGTGKTAAFALPILNRIATLESPKRGIKSLILTPTRELALQIAESFTTYGSKLNLKTTVVFGGVGAGPQRIALRAQPDILVATPGRFLDLHNQGFIKMGDLQVFVLDEADRMLDMGFIHDVKRIISLLPKPRQNLLFSATMPPAISNLAMSFLVKPAKVAVTPVSSTSELVAQHMYYVDRTNKRYLLVHVLKECNVTRGIVFTRTKAIANRVTEFLLKSGVAAEAIHGNKSQNARQRALENFKNAKTRILVASDIAARGIDVDGISHVINYDVPNIPETYVHRIGRTGRAEASGEAISFCDQEERSFVRDIEKLIGKKVPVVSEHPFPAGTVIKAEPIPNGSNRPGTETPRPRRPSGGPQNRGGSSRSKSASGGSARSSGGGQRRSSGN